jgi:hypothetical protein
VDVIGSRRILLVATRSGEDPLTDATAVTQARWPERVFMPTADLCPDGFEWLSRVGSGHSHQISLTSSRFRYQALRGLRRSLSLDLPVSRSQVHTTSFARDLPPGARELTRSRGFT